MAGGSSYRPSQGAWDGEPLENFSGESKATHPLFPPCIPLLRPNLGTSSAAGAPKDTDDTLSGRCAPHPPLNCLQAGLFPASAGSRSSPRPRVRRGLFRVRHPVKRLTYAACMDRIHPFYGNLTGALTPTPQATPGQSSYFSTPEDHLDPDLFDGTHLKPDVRKTLLDPLENYWAAHYANPKQWHTAYLAGSGITYQWSASRGNGDLDVLIVVDFPRFFWDNPGYSGLSDDEMATELTTHLRQDVWPGTDNTPIGSKVYEVTYFVNPAPDLQSIKAYASYDITHDHWDIDPADHPAQHPPEFAAAAERDVEAAQKILDDYQHHADAIKAHATGSPTWVTHASELRRITAQAARMYDDIHLGRRSAFNPTGEGYADWHNYRWQAGKNAGIINPLRELKNVGDKATETFDAATYGRTLATPADTVREALLHTRKH